MSKRESTSEDSWDTATGILRLASELIDGIQQGITLAGFLDVRPMHGYAFALLSEAPATTAQLADHLGITKQATSELVQHLVDGGYLTRINDPSDRRARLLVLTHRGHACTAAAAQAARATVDAWEERLSAGHLDLRAVVAALATPGRLRPAW